MRAVIALYLLVPVLLTGSLWLAVRGRRTARKCLLAVLPLVVALAAAVLMWHRTYLTSLGW